MSVRQKHECSGCSSQGKTNMAEFYFFSDFIHLNFAVHVGSHETFV
jgi:hypothetical protein